MGFFDGLTNVWSNWATDWSDVWAKTKKGGSDVWHGFQDAAGTVWNGAMTPGSFAVTDPNFQIALGKSLGQMGSGGASLLGGVGQVPVIRQIGGTSLWATKELVNRPLAGYELQVGDA